METIYRCLKYEIFYLDKKYIQDICKNFLDGITDSVFSITVINYYKDISKEYYKDKITLENSERLITNFPFLVSFTNELPNSSRLNLIALFSDEGNYELLSDEDKDILLKLIYNKRVSPFLIPIEYRSLEICINVMQNRKDVSFRFVPDSLKLKVLDYAIVGNNYRDMDLSWSHYSNLDIIKLLEIASKDCNIFKFFNFNMKIEKYIIKSVEYDINHLLNLDEKFITSNVITKALILYGPKKIHLNYPDFNKYWINSVYTALEVIKRYPSSYKYFTYKVRSNDDVIKCLFDNIKYDIEVLEYLPKGYYKSCGLNIFKNNFSSFRIYDMDKQIKKYPYEAAILYQNNYENQLEKHHITYCLACYPDTIIYFDRVIPNIELLSVITDKTFFMILDRIPEELSFKIIEDDLHLDKPIYENVIKNITDDIKLYMVLTKYPILLSYIEDKKLTYNIVELLIVSHPYLLNYIFNLPQYSDYIDRLKGLISKTKYNDINLLLKK